MATHQQSGSSDAQAVSKLLNSATVLGLHNVVQAQAITDVINDYFVTESVPHELSEESLDLGDSAAESSDEESLTGGTESSGHAPAVPYGKFTLSIIIIVFISDSKICLEKK